MVTMNAVEFVRKKPKKIKISDIDIEIFYEEALGGSGGAPGGIERDLITKFFGDGDNFGSGDHAAALDNLKERMKTGEGVVGEDDGKGWIWLVCELPQNPNKQMSLWLQKSAPTGMRPLLVAKQDDVDSVFEQLDWKMVRRRLNEVFGVRDYRGKTAEKIKQAREKHMRQMKALEAEEVVS